MHGNAPSLPTAHSDPGIIVFVAVVMVVVALFVVIVVVSTPGSKLRWVV